MKKVRHISSAYALVQATHVLLQQLDNELFNCDSKYKNEVHRISHEIFELKSGIQAEMFGVIDQETELMRATQDAT